MRGTPTCGKWISFCAIAPQKRGHVARGSDAEAERDWVARCVGRLVQRSRIKASRGTNDRDGLRASRSDGEPGRFFSGRIPLRTHRHHYRSRIGYRPGQRDCGRRSRVIEHKLVARCPSHPGKRRRLARQLIGLRGNISLPSNPCDREALSLRESITGISGLVGLARSGLGNIVETLKRELGATIGDVKWQLAVATKRIGRAHQHDAGYGLHQAPRVSWCFVEIGNDSVARISRIDGNGGSRRNFYVRTDAA